MENMYNDVRVYRVKTTVDIEPRTIINYYSQVNTSDLLKIPDGKSTLSLTGVTKD